jgi:hypothetical protein
LEEDKTASSPHAFSGKRMSVPIHNMSPDIGPSPPIGTIAIHPRVQTQVQTQVPIEKFNGMLELAKGTTDVAPTGKKRKVDDPAPKKVFK